LVPNVVFQAFLGGTHTFAQVFVENGVYRTLSGFGADAAAGVEVPVPVRLTLHLRALTLTGVRVPVGPFRAV